MIDVERAEARKAQDLKNIHDISEYMIGKWFNNADDEDAVGRCRAIVGEWVVIEKLDGGVCFIDFHIIRHYGTAYETREALEQALAHEQSVDE